jgi:TnpA family transposase
MPQIYLNCRGSYGDNPTRLAQAIAEFGRIDKTLHSLRYIDDKDMRRSTLTQLNRTEGRRSVARVVFSGNGANCGNATARANKINSARSDSLST